MIGEVLLTGLNSALASAALALVAWIVHASGRQPRIAWLLWLLVLIRLVTPPIWSLPLVEVPLAEERPPATAPLTELGPALDPVAAGVPLAAPLQEAAPVAIAVGGAADPAPASGSPFGWQAALVAVWLLGSLAVLLVSLARIVRFWLARDC